jgi:broad specificity phosphatase PhoE
VSLLQNFQKEKKKINIFQKHINALTILIKTTLYLYPFMLRNIKSNREILNIELFAKMTRKTDIYLVRHGVTDYNNAGKMQGLLDIPLNETGKKQALNVPFNLKNHLGERTPKKIFSSPLKRAKYTAKAIASHYELDVELVDDLKELDIGDYGGAVFEEMDKTEEGKKIKEAFIDNAEKSDNFRYPNGESKLEARMRFFNQVYKLAQDNQDKDIIIIVAHGFVIKQFIMHITQNRNADRWLPGNCGITKAVFNHETQKIDFDKIIFKGEFSTQYLGKKE